MLRTGKILLGLFFWICFLCLNNTVSAQETIFDKFEQVRQIEGPQMLGAAERIVYSLNPEQASIFVLMLEDELKANWLDINEPFLDGDLQQLMRSAFGEDFAPAKLAELPSYEVRRIIRQTLDRGYAIEDRNGHFYPWPDYNYLLRAYGPRVTAEVRDYLAICVEESKLLGRPADSFSQEYQDKAAFLLQLEEFLAAYPVSYRSATVASLYNNKLADYLVKMPNSYQAIQAGKLRPEAIESYQNIAAAYPYTTLGKLTQEVAAAWLSENLNYNKSVMDFLASLEQRIAVLTTEQVKGIYLRENIFELFKIQGTKDYLLLSGYNSALASLSEETGKNTSNYIFLELRGIKEKTLPVDLADVTYPETFVIEDVLSSAPLKLADELFQADFTATNSNQQWFLRILTNDEILFEIPAQKLLYRFKYQAPLTEVRNRTEHFTYQLSESNHAAQDRMTINISKEWARDRLLGIDFAYRAQVDLNGRKYEGYAFRPGQYPANPDSLSSP